MISTFLGVNTGSLFMKFDKTYTTTPTHRGFFIPLTCYESENFCRIDLIHQSTSRIDVAFPTCDEETMAAGQNTKRNFDKLDQQGLYSTS